MHLNCLASKLQQKLENHIAKCSIKGKNFSSRFLFPFFSRIFRVCLQLITQHQHLGTQKRGKKIWRKCFTIFSFHFPTTQTFPYCSSQKCHCDVENWIIFCWKFQQLTSEDCRDSMKTYDFFLRFRIEIKKEKKLNMKVGRKMIPTKPPPHCHWILKRNDEKIDNAAGNLHNFLFPSNFSTFNFWFAYEIPRWRLNSSSNNSAACHISQ